MKYYDKKFIDSKNFYINYYVPYKNLESKILNEAIENDCINDLDEIREYTNEEYQRVCEEFFSENIYFYDELSKHIFDENMMIQPLDNYIFLKLQYCATKFFDIENEGQLYFEMERMRFEKETYSEGLKQLVKFYFHDTDFKIYYKDDELYIHFSPNQENEAIFKFRGVLDKQVPEFVTFNPVMVCQEIYETPEGLFHFNILCRHRELGGGCYSELIVDFTSVERIK